MKQCLLTSGCSHLILIFGMCNIITSCISGLETQLENGIQDAYNSNADFKMVDVTPFEWDRLYVFPPLIQVAREDSEEEIRQRAIEGLRYFAGEDVGEVVLACLDDPDSLARIEAMETLETLSYSPAVEKISELLIADEDELVRRYAATAIGYLQGEDPSTEK